MYHQQYNLYNTISEKLSKQSPGVGHILEAHVRVSLADTMHFVPLFPGSGLVHDRVRS